MNTDIFQAVQAVKDGKVIIYPTETFFALGGAGRDPEVVRKIREIKARPYHKPLPLIAGSLAQCLEEVEMDSLSLKIAQQFWPGPLSLLVRAREMIPFGVKDSENMVSIRVTPHPDAARLCLMSGTPLIATSANFSKEPSRSDFDDLDKQLTDIVSLILNSEVSPAGGLPSTLVKVVGMGRLRIIREGKISFEEIAQKGWEILS